VVQPPSLIIGQKALGVVLSPQTVKSGSTDDDSLSNSNNSCNHKHVDSGGGGSSSRGGDSGVGLRGHTGYPDMHGGAHRSGPLRLKKHRNQLSNTGSSQQGPEEEGALVSPKVHLRLVRLVQCQEPKVSYSRVRHMLGRVRGWGEAQGVAPMRPCLPSPLHQYMV